LGIYAFRWAQKKKIKELGVRRKKMNTIKFENKGNIKMIAHRGLSGLEKENTCPAFVAAGVKVITVSKRTCT
jgi:glycerophosphoryl diester phosphodiesterase